MLGPLDFLDGIFGEVAEVLGWTWEKVVTGIFTWFAKGVLLLMEWVFSQLDAATTARITDDWFANGLVRQVAVVGVGITTIMMLISAVQMGWAGRPELFGDAIRNGAKAIIGSAVTVVLIDAGTQAGDVLAGTIWAAGRSDVLSLMDGTASGMTVGAEVIGVTFLGPFLIMVGLIGFLMITTILFFRSVMIYLVAAFAPIPIALSTGPSFRGATRRVVSLTLALILAKPAIVLTIVVGAKLTANAGTDTGVAEGLGALISGFLVFLVAGFAPMVIFKLLPMVGDASMTTGVMAGMGRSATTAAQAGLIASSVGGMASPATRAVAGQAAGSAGGGSSSGASTGGANGNPATGGAGVASATALPLIGAASTGAGGGGAAGGSGPVGIASGMSPANQPSNTSGAGNSRNSSPTNSGPMNGEDAATGDGSSRSGDDFMNGDNS